MINVPLDIGDATVLGHQLRALAATGHPNAEACALMLRVGDAMLDAVASAADQRRAHELSLKLGKP